MHLSGKLVSSNIDKKLAMLTIEILAKLNEVTPFR
jgi:hypothetical protein